MNRSRTIFVVAVAIAILTMAFAVCAQAYPTCLNVIPTADVLVNGSIQLAYESDGKNTPVDHDCTGYTFTQIGIGGRVEAGVDFCDVTGETDKLFNAKYLLLGESIAVPAVAAGVMNVGNDSDASYYLVGTKGFGKSRFHAGAQTQNGSSWGLFGMDFAASKSVKLLFDWQTGPGRGHTAGISWQATPALGVLLYYLRNNSAELRESGDFVGLWVGYSLNLGL